MFTVLRWVKHSLAAADGPRPYECAACSSRFETQPHTCPRCGSYRIDWVGWREDGLR